MSYAQKHLDVMSLVTPPSPIRDVDYDAIESALADSPQGRWFLAEYIKRNQPAEFTSLREALTKLEHSVGTPGPALPGEGLRRDLLEMSNAITRTRREIAAIKPSDDEDSQLLSATGELDAIVSATEKATSDILEAAEDIQEVAWLLREKGTEDAACDRLDERATEIYMGCSFQDITGQRIEKVVNVLRFLESRVVAMINIWGLDLDGSDVEMPGDAWPDADLLNGPQLDGHGLDQGDIDLMIEAVAIDRDIDDVTDMAAVETGPPDMQSEAVGVQAEPVIQQAEAVAAAIESSSPQAEVAALQTETFEPTDQGVETETSVETLDDEQVAALFS